MEAAGIMAVINRPIPDTAWSVMTISMCFLSNWRVFTIDNQLLNKMGA